MGEQKKGTYHYKVALGSSGWTATPFGEMAEGLPECSGANAAEVEKAMYEACKEASGFPEFTYANDMVTPKMSLFTACIGTAKAGAVVAAPAGGGGGGGGGGGAAAAAAGSAPAAKAPEPEPEEEEEEMGFDLFD
mmetsp:Transcript_2876/g.8803  ORF Transcript_2876/g.8803 Transcript_2876/m.8803 type:complete len:135 (-) Transcript_2876:420-824(-)